MAAVAIDGLLVAKPGWDGQAMFDYNGGPVIIEATQGKRLGTIVAKDHPIAREHAELFMPLVITPEYD